MEVFGKQQTDMQQAANKSRHDNHYQPPCFDDFTYLQPQPLDRRSPPLVGVPALFRSPKK